MPEDRVATLSEKYGFSLKSVSWGYRETFEKIIKELIGEGAIGEEKPEVTKALFGLLKQADQSCYDHLLKDFLSALNPKTRWLMDLPGIFSSVVDLGYRLSQIKFYYGTIFFRVLGRGGVGRTPEEVRYLVNTCNWLISKEARLAIAFADGYSALLEDLTLKEMDYFIRQMWPIYTRNTKAAVDYLSVRSKAADNVIKSITRECRLKDISGQLHALLRALVGYKVEVSDLSGLDTDELVKRNTAFVCVYKWCFIPSRVRQFDTPEKNRDWYRLLSVVSAGMLSLGSFPCIQGKEGCRNLPDFVDGDVIRQNLVAIIEHARVMRRIPSMWSGAARLIDFGIHTEFEHRPAKAPVDKLLYDLLMEQGEPALEKILKTSVNVFDTAEMVTHELCETFRSVASRPLRSFSFLPDFWYPVEVSVPERDKMVGDLMEQAESAKQRRSEGGEEESEEESSQTNRDSQKQEDKKEEEEEEPKIGFVYPEWSNVENDYLDNFCLLHEHQVEADGRAKLPPGVLYEAQRVRQIFEKLKPEAAGKEKYLQEGDDINIDLLYDYMINQKKEPSPRVRFYERPVVNKRDLAVSILMDISGSTANKHGDSTVMELEKHAAIILAEGLKRVGDRFEINGFTSNGRRDCEFLLIKTFEQEWNRKAIHRLQYVVPGNYTRIGVALRHAGRRLSKIGARQRLIILITDGKPMDSDYSPENGYAQQDVRVACEENARQEIHTFGISTEENTLSDMEIMFPRRRFAILSDMSRLPRVLPRLYLRLTF